MFFCIVEKYCCCSVRTGSIVTALVELVLTFLSVIACFVVWALNPEDKLNPLVFGLPLTLLFVYAFISILVLIGVALKSQGLLLPWLIVNFIMHLLLITGIFVCAAFVFIWSPKDVNESFLLFIILGIIALFLYKAYTWAIVRSHHKQIREEGYNLQFE
ncbi:hypothetical protein ACFFRR_002888 [Megaselia abdita]